MIDTLLRRWLKNDEEAIDLVSRFISVSSFYDDLIDRDRKPSDAEIHLGMWNALFGVQQNAFFIKHRATLEPLVQMALMNWRIANLLERHDELDDLHIAFIIRSSYADVVVACAALVGGIEWAIEQGVEIRRVAHMEKMGGYLTALEAERKARD